MTTKVRIKKCKATSFGGIFYIIDQFNSYIGSVIDSVLGKRVKTFGYGYSEIFRALFCVYFCGGDCIEDINNYLKGQLEQMPKMRVPSPDTILRGIKELATDNISYESKSGKTYHFNTAERLNGLLVSLLLSTRILEQGEAYDMDFDHEYLETEKYDTLYTYKKFRGYSPGVATIGNNIVHIENRDGNTNVKFHQADTFERIFSNLEGHGIKIRRARMDCGSYSKDIIDVVRKHCETFYIRAMRCESLYGWLMRHDNWKPVEIGNIKYEVISVPFDSIEGIDHCRLVVQRQKRENGELDIWEGEYTYRCIVTNDWDMEDEEVIEFYNQRGKQEKIFDEMDNDFGWKALPKSFMNENTVFLLITAMIKNFFNFIVAKDEMRKFGIKENARIKQLIFKFISVPAKWIRTSGQHILNIYSNRPYQLVYDS